MNGRALFTMGLVALTCLACGSAAIAAGVGEIYQTAEWTTEKHVPVIQCPDVFRRGEMTAVIVEIGKAIPHPNTTAHHIAWIRLYFVPEGSPYAYEIGSADFGAHGASVEGPDTSTVYTNHRTTFEFRTDVPGTLYATSLCNIHGLWQSEKKVAVAG